MKTTVAVFIALLFTQIGSAQSSEADMVTQSPIYPIVSLLDGNCLMGALQDGVRLSDAEAATRLMGNEVYRIYTMSGFAGRCVGTAPASAPVPCAENWRITFSPPIEGVIAMGGDWNALPRLPKLVSSSMFIPSVKKIAKEYGIVKPKISKIEAYSVDLDGDRKSEFIVSARYFENDVQESSNAGEYSMVFVKRGKEILFVSSNFYLNDGNYNLPVSHKLTGIMDINGDGKMELVVRSRNKEGSQTSIYHIHQNRAELLFFCSCGM
ncbi:MAG: VCBS repeat-containing protein [Chloroherpetonaceae bacterium]